MQAKYILLIIALLAIGWWTTRFINQPQTNIVVNMRLIPITTELHLSQLLIFDIGLRTTTPIQVKIISDLYSTENKQSYFSLPDNFTISKNMTKRYKISLPSAVTPGTYTLRSLLLYNGKKILASTPIFIKPLPRAPIPAPTQTKPEPVHTNITPPTQTPITKIPEEIIKACPEEQIDLCVSNHAIKTNTSTLCTAISDTNIRDNCYITFIEEGALDLCQHINFPEFKAYCTALLTSQTIPAQAMPIEETLILESTTQNLVYSIEVIE